MSFKSYISVEVKKPKGFYDWPESEQDLFCRHIAAIQKCAEKAYTETVEKASGVFDFDFKYDIESK